MGKIALVGEWREKKFGTWENTDLMVEKRCRCGERGKEESSQQSGA